MLISLLSIGSIVGFVAATITLIAGQALLTAIVAYFISALLSVGIVIAVCAWKHAARNRHQQHGFSASLNE